MTFGIILRDQATWHDDVVCLSAMLCSGAVQGGTRCRGLKVVPSCSYSRTLPITSSDTFAVRCLV